MTTTTSPAARGTARRFFWVSLITTTAASILGNVTHALLNSQAGSPAIAAVAALVPPIVLLGAMHGVHALVCSRIVGAAYWCALLIAVALALCAFVLSFASLRDLATQWAGMRPAVAWLWPLAIDLSITGSSIALLALSSAHRDAQRTHTHLSSQTAAAPPAVHVSVHASSEAHSTHTTVAELLQRDADEQHVARVLPTTDPAIALDDRWAAHLSTAERIVTDGVTRIDRVKVAQVLAEHHDGTAPATIARKLGVGYSTVVRIVGRDAQTGAAR